MTKDEILEMHNTIKSNPLKLKHHPTWIKAFEEYNQQAERPLSMTCYPCYTKVIRFHLKQLHA